MYVQTLQPVGPTGFLLPGFALMLERPLLSPEGLDVPLADLFVFLRSLGWARARDASEDIAPDPLLDVHIGPDGVWLYAANLWDITAGMIMSDSGPPPSSPPGWWSQVEAFGHCCMVSLVAATLDASAGTSFVDGFNRAAQQGSVLMARARVVRDRPGDFMSV